MKIRMGDLEELKTKLAKKEGEKNVIDAELKAELDENSLKDDEERSKEVSDEDAELLGISINGEQMDAAYAKETGVVLDNNKVTNSSNLPEEADELHESDELDDTIGREPIRRTDKFPVNE